MKNSDNRDESLQGQWKCMQKMIKAYDEGIIRKDTEKLNLTMMVTLKL